MEKWVFVVLMALMVLPLAGAAVLNEQVHLSRIRIGDSGFVSGGHMDTYVYVYNGDSEEKVRDGSLSIRLMDEEVYDSAGDIRIKPNEGKSQSFWTDLDYAEEGEHLVKITFTAADGVRKTKYRYVTFG